jgi:hypothetical protein
VAHTHNPSYSGGRDQEDCSLKPAQVNSSQAPSQKTSHRKRAGGVAQGVGPEFKPQYCKKRKKTRLLKSGMVAHACHPSNQGTEAGRL